MLNSFELLGYISADLSNRILSDSAEDNREVYDATLAGVAKHAGQLAQLATDLNLGTRINQGTNGARKTERGQIYLTMEAALALGLPLDTLPESTDSDYGKLLREATKLSLIHI